MRRFFVYPMPKSNYNQYIADDLIVSKEFNKKLLYVEDYDCFFLFNGKYYKQYDIKKTLAKIREILINRNYKKNITIGILKDICEQIKLATPLSKKELYTNYITFKDKDLNLNTFETEEHSRDNYSMHYLDFNYKEIEHAETPNFDKFLETSLVDKDGNTDYGLIELVIQMIGYYLLKEEATARMAFFLIGEANTGKSTLQNLLKSIVGEEFTVAINIKTLTENRFATADLTGAVLNNVSDEQSTFSDVGTFKALITCDYVRAERKNQGAFFFSPKTKHIFSTNKMPTFKDFDNAIKRRIKLIPFKKKIEKRDLYLLQKLKKEIPGIIGKALIRAKELTENGLEFIKPKSIIEENKKFEEAMSSAIFFIREKYDNNKENGTSKKDIYDHYKRWAVSNGRRSMNSARFFRDLKTMGLKEIKWVDGKRVNGYSIILKEKKEEEQIEIKSFYEKNNI